MALNALAYLIAHLLKYQLSKNHNYIIVINKITHMWRMWGTPQSFYLALTDELGKQLLKNCWKVTSAIKRELLKICYMRHRLRLFLSHGKVNFCSSDIQVFIFLTIPWFTKSVRKDVFFNFWIYLWRTRVRSQAVSI